MEARMNPRRPWWVGLSECSIVEGSFRLTLVFHVVVAVVVIVVVIVVVVVLVTMSAAANFIDIDDCLILIRKVQLSKSTTFQKSLYQLFLKELEL